MATLVLDVEDALLQRISSIAAERGKNSAQYVVEVVQQALERQDTIINPSCYHARMYVCQ